MITPFNLVCRRDTDRYYQQGQGGPNSTGNEIVLPISLIVGVQGRYYIQFCVPPRKPFFYWVF